MTKELRLTRGLFAALILGLATSAANAAPVTWVVTGKVDNSVAWTLTPLAAPYDFELRYTFDFDGLSDTQGGNTAVSIWNGALKSAVLTIGGVSLPFAFNLPDPSSNVTRIDDDRGSGSSRTDGFNLSASGDTAYGTVLFMLKLENYGPAPLAPLMSDSFPSTPPDPLAFVNRGLSVSFLYGNQFQSVSSITLASHSVAPPVPLPAAAWLLLSGMGAIGAVARRRKRAALT